MKSENHSEILLESGTNELEVIVFKIGQETFGINVMKVREIIQPPPLTKMPNSHAFVEGVVRLREEVIPVVDVAKALRFPPSANPGHDKYIVAELNQQKVAFHVHSVSMIHRISWEQIEKPAELSQGLEGSTIGVVKMDEQMVLLLDYEKLVADISPQSSIHVDKLKVLGTRERSLKKIIVVEDSPILRKQLEHTLTESGYADLRFFENGQDAWLFLDQLASNDHVQGYVNLMITDLEMPKMDGHHLTKKIKSSQELKGIPVIIFSSLISGDLKHKGEVVGADAQVSKPDIANLVQKIDQLIL
ncbi:chemotaxis protein [Desertibacillus haloalkaliphilus]|uniref:chemotaxis protein n=1 Tax=Desertibacillus haloalkaliphilus TaxID=1328930 RepID=UPI001C272458|nr:chemotaxis protein [Desertibacillus haloalkaliphilus]MBU8907301.1 chemotaxis protein [Desertibacillus haloalkaliphilus]